MGVSIYNAAPLTRCRPSSFHVPDPSRVYKAQGGGTAGWAIECGIALRDDLGLIGQTKLKSH
ncbi:hypothetical protein KEJ13_06850 [Candidatus Bathyarchaeota archaeon]|nr:hypothetical protein [Candidatus Bathyarchaeota archaeon]